jgi:hypothetical protein
VINISLLTKCSLLREELWRNTHSSLSISRIVTQKLTNVKTAVFSKGRKEHHFTNTPHPLQHIQTDIPVVPDYDITNSYAHTARGNCGSHAPTITIPPNDLSTISFMKRTAQSCQRTCQQYAILCSVTNEDDTAFGSTALLSVCSVSEVRLPGGSKARTEAHRVTSSFVQCIFCVGWCASSI